jgi:hypothetical protein
VEAYVAGDHLLVVDGHEHAPLLVKHEPLDGEVRVERVLLVQQTFVVPAVPHQPLPQRVVDEQVHLGVVVARDRVIQVIARPVQVRELEAFHLVAYAIHFFALLCE